MNFNRIHDSMVTRFSRHRICLTIFPCPGAQHTPSQHPAVCLPACSSLNICSPCFPPAAAATEPLDSLAFKPPSTSARSWNAASLQNACLSVSFGDGAFELWEPWATVFAVGAWRPTTHGRRHLRADARLAHPLKASAACIWGAAHYTSTSPMPLHVSSFLANTVNRRSK